jgi:hypothetical protein
MPDVGFADLVLLYRNIVFDGAGGGILHVADDDVAAAIRRVEADEATYDLTQISLVEPGAFAVGDHLQLNVGQPGGGLGELAADFDALFRMPGAAFSEPRDYYVIDPGYARDDEPAPDIIGRYRALLRVVDALREGASYVDLTARELVFIGDEKVVIPVSFRAADLPDGLEASAARLTRIFEDPLHGDEKIDLFSAAVVEITRGARRTERFRHLVANLDWICDQIEKGYRLFVSSFSFSKIRKEIETARLEYVGKIHKTIVDIQGQLLGIPVATIVVASQLKKPNGCDVVFWANGAVVLGAWTFIGLLWLAIRNQQHTLVTIGKEIGGQKARLESDYAAVKEDFVGTFADLEKRITWHRWVLRIVLALALLGAAGATWAWLMLTPSGSSVCLRAE